MFMGNKQSEDKTWDIVIGGKLLVRTCKKYIKVDNKSIDL